MNSAINVQHIQKYFGQTQAVKDVSFEVRPGEIFGLLGPNGSGKTTSIRIILDIYKPDAGKVEVLGGAMDEDKKNRIGYLPEERGLYQDVPLERCLTYLATLKGMTEEEVKAQLPAYLEKFDLTTHARKKVKELSKGMQQKAQLIATLIHQPDLIIIDEPFSALDPVNTQLVKDLLVEQRKLGKAIIMSTHQMSQVEMLCDSLVLINSGEVLLDGSLRAVRDQFSSDYLLIETDSQLPATLPGIAEIVPQNTHIKLVPQADMPRDQVLPMLMREGIQLKSFQYGVPSLEEIFIKVVREGGPQNE